MNNTCKDGVFFTVKTVKNGFFTLFPDGFEGKPEKLPEFPITMVYETQRLAVKEGARGKMTLDGDTVSLEF